MRGYIYCILDPDGYYYIGSTFNLTSRLQGHKMSVQGKGKQQKCHKHFEISGWENLVITTFEEPEVNDRNELYEIEEKYLSDCKEDPLCLNAASAENNRIFWKNIYRSKKDEENS
jgi:GIY-YIG catalytic domain